jgi:hypothetical protein
LKQHLSTCNKTLSNEEEKSSPNITNTSNNINVVNNQGTIIQNNIQINIYGSTLSAVSQEVVHKRLYKRFKQSIPDLVKVIETAMQNLVRNEKKNPIIICCDKNRFKFKLRYDDGDVEDDEARKTIDLFFPTLLEACDDVAENETDGKIKHDIKMLIDAINTRTPKTLRLLRDNVPRKFKNNDVKTDKIFSDNKNAKDKALTKIKELFDKEKAKNKAMIIDNLFHVIDVNGNYVHPRLGYLVQFPDTSSKDFIIVGKRDGETDKGLDKDDIIKIKEMGLEECLHEKYRKKNSERLK